MRILRWPVAAAFALAVMPALPLAAQRRPRGVQVMTLASADWKDGGVIPAKHSQPGRDVSPALSWSAAPAGTASFVLLVHDVDAPVGNGLDDTLHWLLWDIPATARSLPEGIPGDANLPDGSRQISISGPYYRGPAAPASGPVHHYVFELFALDTVVSVPAIGSSPAATRAAVLAEMGGHVRGKATLVGVYRRPR
jgi:Raf kinase inhibitor-like YbhB/YbcL family protein